MSREDDLADRIADLEATLEELRGELGSPPTGPLGLPRPPRPRELLRFADDYAIPAAIAMLEANVRTLELLRGAIRLADPERGAETAGRAVRDRAGALGRETLDRLDRALADLEGAIEDGGGPADPEARELLAEARALNAEIRGRLPATEGDEGGTEIEVADGAVDVDAELESIRDELDEDQRS